MTINEWIFLITNFGVSTTVLFILLTYFYRVLDQLSKNVNELEKVVDLLNENVKQTNVILISKKER